MNDMNKWFYSLTLNELQQYIVKLESENERLIKELSSSTKLNSILENIAKSTQTGYSILRRIEINKDCECNEHLNQPLRKSLNESINETNILLNHLHIYHSIKDSETMALNNQIPDEDIVDITSEHSNESSVHKIVRHSVDDKDSAMSSSPSSSGYESMDYSQEQRGGQRVPDMVFHSEYSQSESHVSKGSSAPEEREEPEELPQNLSKPKSPQFSPIANPMAERSTSSPSNSSFPSSGSLIDKNKHLPNKCPECDLSFNLKPCLEQHLLTHISPTFTVQRAGRGRPSKNDSRILRVTDSDLNILRMSDALGTLPDGLISLSALEELRRTKYAGYGRYRCPWPDCGYTPHFLRDLRRHMFKHTGDKKYKCDYGGCDFITVWKTSLLQHQRKKHNITDPNIQPTKNT